jgi:hypothetical protein
MTTTIKLIPTVKFGHAEPDKYIWKNPENNKKTKRYGLYNENEEIIQYFSNLSFARDAAKEMYDLNWDSSLNSYSKKINYPRNLKNTKYDELRHGETDLTKMFVDEDEFCVTTSSVDEPTPKVSDHLLKFNDAKLRPPIYENTIDFEDPVDTNARILQDMIEDIKAGRYL